MVVIVLYFLCFGSCVRNEAAEVKFLLSGEAKFLLTSSALLRKRKMAILRMAILRNVTLRNGLVIASHTFWFRCAHKEKHSRRKLYTLNKSPPPHQVQQDAEQQWNKASSCIVRCRTSS
jgi:hypothetical protein